MRFETSSSARVELSSDTMYVNVSTRIQLDFCTVVIFGCLKIPGFLTLLKRAGLEGALVLRRMKPS